MKQDRGLKRLAIWTGNRAGAYPIGRLISRVIYKNSFVRAVNYHDTHLISISNFREQLKFFQNEFTNVNPKNLYDLMSGHWDQNKPGILLSFDDGLLSHYEVAAPLLEEFGMTGWFFVPAGWIINDDETKPRKNGPNGPTMSIGEVRDLVARGHVIGCHTQSHVRLSDDLSTETLEKEVVNARQQLEDILGSPVNSFCWVGGEEFSYSQGAAEKIEKAGYRWSFMTNCSLTTARTHPHWIDRTNIESDWPVSKVQFYISGIMDLAYVAKRRRLKIKLNYLDKSLGTDG